MEARELDVESREPSPSDDFEHIGSSSSDSDTPSHVNTTQSHSEGALEAELEESGFWGEEVGESDERAPESAADPSTRNIVENAVAPSDW